jgi:class 3 adenylate cyclase
MSTRSFRRLPTGSTGKLRKQNTRILDEPGQLITPQPVEMLLSQIEKLLTENEHLSARFDAIGKVAVAVNSSLRPEDIIQVIGVKSEGRLGFAYFGLGLLSAGGKTCSLRHLAWPGGGPPPGPQEFEAGTGLSASVLSTGKPLTVVDLFERPLKTRPAQVLGFPNPEIEGRLVSASIRSLMILPLKASGTMLGYLAFGKKHPNYYDQDDLQLAYFFSTLLATALRNSRIFDAEVRRSHQLQLLSDIGQTVASILDSSALIAAVPSLVQAQFGYEVAKIGLLEGEAIVYPAEAQYISGSPAPREVRLAVSRNGMPIGIAGMAAFTGQVVLVPNIYEDDRWSDVLDSLSGPQMRSVLIIPLTARDRVLGVLHFESERVNAFDASEVSILQSLANQLGVSLDNARLYGQLNELFHGYIAPQVASTLLDDPQNAQLGGQRREITVLFADLNGFTGLSEQMPAEELIDLLNACLGAATDVILEYGGTLDKYMGDAVMALFNAPQNQPDHAWRAVRAAIAVQRRMAELTVNWKYKVHFSVGLHTGEAVIGNIGSSSLRNYTAIGDTVNLAKRIQEMAASDQVLLSQDTYESALTMAPNTGPYSQEAVVAYSLGSMTIRGRSKPAVLYEVNPHSQPLKITHTRLELPRNITSPFNDLPDGTI